MLPGLVDLHDVGVRAAWRRPRPRARNRASPTAPTWAPARVIFVPRPGACNRRVAGLVDHAHAASPELLQDVVTGHDHVLERGRAPSRFDAVPVSHRGTEIGIAEAELIRTVGGIGSELAGRSGVGPRSGSRSCRRVEELEVGPRIIGILARASASISRRWVASPIDASHPTGFAHLLKGRSLRVAGRDRLDDAGRLEPSPSPGLDPKTGVAGAERPR